ncbi:MAG: sensor hybrid histidine kinase, partial [Deltaproteobacteria bacterium]|nr:sensor hybrid histidine kinase [Deltaproteobacteria bacterium]
GRDTYEIEHRVVRKSTGEVRIVREKCEHIRDGSGRIVRSVGMVHDITERDHVEKALLEAHDELELRVRERTAELQSAYDTLAENERLYRSLFENGSIGMFQSRLDGSGFLRINRSYATMLGYESPEEVMSSVTDTAAQIHTDPKYRDELLAALEGKEWYYAEQPYYRKDGSVMTGRLAVRRVRNPDGTPAYLEGIVEDITESKRTEEALRESEAFNRRLFESNRTAIVVMDAETARYVDCNPAAVNIYRYASREEVIGKTPLDVSADMQYDGTPSREKANYYIKEARDKGFITFEWFHRRPDGQYWDALVHLMSFELRGHQFLQFSLYDITEQKKTEEALKQAEAKYRTIFENAGMGIFQTTPEGRYIAVNPALARIYGYESPQEMIETITDIGGQTYVNPEDRVRLVGLIKEHGVVENFETQFYRKDKSTGWVSANTRAVKDIDGSIMYFEGTIEDITERKHAKKALQESEEKYRSVVESSFVGLSIIQDRVFRFVNKGFCEITGYAYDELVDRLDPLDITYPADRKTAELAMMKGLTSEAGNTEFGCRIVRKNGQVSYVKVFGTSLLYNGRPSAAGTIIDVTREKDLEMQLVRTQKLEAIGTLAGGIAHDFNNILAGIIGFTEMVRDDMPSDTREHHRLGLVLKGAHRGRDLVRQILTFSRQTGHEQKPVTLSEIVEESLKLLRPLLPATIEIRSKGPAGDDTVLADAAQMHQVLMNLCTNGTQAMGKRGVLEVGVSRDHFKRGSHMPSPGMKPGDYVTLTVRDTGPGMKPEVLERIFDPFFTTKLQGEGTGLGLSVVHGIVKSHGGFIKVESEPGKGSVFSIYLPKLERQEAIAPREELSVMGGKECILFIDDEDILVELNSERLTQLGYEVVATTSSIEALEIFKKDPRKFDLVITDYTMPDMTGVDLARKFLKVRSDIPIVLCTGYNDDISSDKAKRAGIKEFLLKPQDKRQLDLTIRKVLDLEIL